MNKPDKNPLYKNKTVKRGGSAIDLIKKSYYTSNHETLGIDSRYKEDLDFIIQI